MMTGYRKAQQFPLVQFHKPTLDQLVGEAKVEAALG